MTKWHYIWFLFLNGCATYIQPTTGELANIKIMSNARYMNIQVDICLTEDCELPKSLGQLSGLGFMETDSIEKEKGDLKKRFVREFKVRANIPSYIRFITEKTILILGDEPKSSISITSALGMTVYETIVSYVKEKKQMKCVALVKIIPVSNSSFLIMHDHDEKTQECSATVEKLLN